ncbi:HD domain-containing protein [Alkalihalobacillus pseudalcaliphilus]|uniref:HD domain-containing protein n=1 Tax=Alkalihalobacillus pseudalcaliphilus TaxID=79884 RepID=UPI00064DA75F|nr:HD domain-containing protein [Alkalihalobacillus pseudalcaliphilus]KMK75245.1 hypothetical protein AB990_17605 [Alkalihalobacillus pseudalcaliphilus]
MNIYDPIYGQFTIDNVLVELIESEPMQRLKHIHQGGASYLVNPKWNVTRFEHSIGVMLLIKKMGGSIEEQIAGLLHDVSHTAFSHVVDFVLDHPEENYHELIFNEVVRSSPIPQILEKYQFRYEDILYDDSQWTLLEQPAPELCADRVDYTLRDMFTYGEITKEEVEHFLDNLVVREGNMYINDLESAEWFVETYYKEVINFFMDPLNLYAYERLSTCLKLALDKGVIDMEDFMKTDKVLMNKMKLSTDKEMNTLLNELNCTVRVEENKELYHFHQKTKLRLIDPSVFVEGELLPASSLSNKIKNMNKQARKKTESGVYVRVISST